MRVQGSEQEEGKSGSGLSVEKMCQVAVVSRAGYYRSFAEECPDEEEMMVRSVIQKIVVEHRRRYGYRRVWFELNHKLGMVVNHKAGAAADAGRQSAGAAAEAVCDDHRFQAQPGDSIKPGAAHETDRGEPVVGG